MGNEPTKYNAQEIFNYSTDDTVSPPLLQVGVRKWNGSSWTRTGLSVYRNIDIDETGKVAKSSAGQVLGWYIHNDSAAVSYVKIYNKATAPTQADTPELTIPIPANAAANVFADTGIGFSAGISVRATTGVADNDTGAPSANDIQINLFYL